MVILSIKYLFRVVIKSDNYVKCHGRIYQLYCPSFMVVEPKLGNSCPARDISQSPLQLLTAMWLSSSQWTISKMTLPRPYTLHTQSSTLKFHFLLSGMASRDLKRPHKLWWAWVPEWLKQLAQPISWERNKFWHSLNH